MDIKKQHPALQSLQDTHPKFKDINRLKVKECQKIYHVNSNQKKAGVVILIPDEIDFQSRNITRWVKEEKRREIGKEFELNESETQRIKIYGM